MSRPITVDSAGRIVLPSEVRRQLNLVAGSRLALAVVAQHIELTPDPEAETGVQLTPGKRTVLRATGQTFDAAAATRDERDAMAIRGSKR